MNLPKLNKDEFLYIDFETTLEKETVRKALVVSLYQRSWDDAIVIAIPQLNIAELYDYIKGAKIVAHNMSFDVSLFGWMWGRGHAELHDTLTLSRLLLNLESNSLASVFKHFGIRYDSSKHIATEFGDLYNKLVKIWGEDEAADNFLLTTEQIKYSKLDALLLADVHEKLLELLPKDDKGNPKYPFHYKIDMRTLDIWTAQIKHGIPINTKVTQELIQEKQEFLDYFLAAYPFKYSALKRAKEYLNSLDLVLQPVIVDNIASSIVRGASYSGKEVRQSELRETIINIPAIRAQYDESVAIRDKINTALADYIEITSTNAKYLAQFANNKPVADLIKARSYRKLLNDYLQKFMSMPNKRMHGLITPTTHTGRARSEAENLQNIPREFKQCIGFEPKDKKLIISCDFSQLELRTIAALTGDKTLITAFQNYDDVHNITARKIFGENFTKEQRTYGKSVTFGTLYMGGANVLWLELLENGVIVPIRQVRQWQKDWKKAYSGITRWHNDSMSALNKSKRGWVIGKRPFTARRVTDYVGALNQGAGAIVAKLAEIYIANLVEEEITKGNLQPNEMIHINFVHDDIWFEVPRPKELDDYIKNQAVSKLSYYSLLLTKAFQKAWREFGKLAPKAKLIPMPVEVEIGYTLKNIIFTYEDKDKEFWEKKFPNKPHIEYNLKD